MGVAKDLTKALFGDFQAWMEKRGFRKKGAFGSVEDPFTTDCYMSKAFDVLYDQYQKDKQREELRKNTVNLFDAETLRAMTMERMALEEKAKERKALTEKNAKAVTEGVPKDGPSIVKREDEPQPEVVPQPEEKTEN